MRSISILHKFLNILISWWARPGDQTGMQLISQATLLLYPGRLLFTVIFPIPKVGHFKTHWTLFIWVPPAAGGEMHMYVRR